MCSSLHLHVNRIYALTLTLVHSTIVVAADGSSGAACSSFVELRFLLVFAELRLEDERFFEAFLLLRLSFDTLLVLPIFPLIVLLVLLESLV